MKFVALTVLSMTLLVIGAYSLQKWVEWLEVDGEWKRRQNRDDIDRYR